MRTLVALAGALLLAACGSLPVTKTAFPPGSIAVLPPRDALHDGAAYAGGAGTGRSLQEHLMTVLRTTSFDPIEVTGDDFDHDTVATKEAALAEANRLGATYCLQVVLGESRDAEPRTIRSDYVTLDQAVMWATASGDEVWRQAKPYVFSRSSYGGLDGLLQRLAKTVVTSITE
jgi:hypothetical protein